MSVFVFLRDFDFKQNKYDTIIKLQFITAFGKILKKLISITIHIMIIKVYIVNDICFECKHNTVLAKYTD